MGLGEETLHNHSLVVPKSADCPECLRRENALLRGKLARIAATCEKWHPSKAVPKIRTILKEV
jgi:hypothetical protein